MDINYKHIIDRAHIGIITLSMDGSIKYVNDKARMELNIDNNHIGTSIQNLIAEIDQNTFNTFIEGINNNVPQQIVLKGQSINKYSYLFKTKNPGSTNESQASYVLGVQQPAKNTSFQDNLFLEAMMSYFPGVVYFKDLQSRFVRVNGLYMSRLAIRNESDLIGKTDYDIFANEHASEAYRDEQEIMKTGKPILDVEEKETWPDGSVTWVLTSKFPWKNEYGAIEGVFGFSRDITDLKKTSEEIHEKTTILNAITKKIPVIIYKYEDQAGITSLFGDPMIINVFGASKMVKISISQNFDQIIKMAKKMKQGYFSFTSTYHEGEKRRHFENYIFQNQFQKTLYMGFSLEVTERKKSENIVKRNAKHLEKINKELNQFAYIISHDLKAPLRAISSLSTWIEEDLKTIQHPDVINNLTLLRNRVNRLENLINGILQYTRAGKTNDVYENINIATLLANLINSIEVPERFSVLIQENIPEIFFSKAVLNQVFQNLITNTIKHHHKNKGTIEIQYRKLKKFHEFAVVDDGPGIDKKFHERIFTIFQTLKSRDKLESTGVGLTIVKKLIEDRGGRILIESEIGKGSRFIFRIPDKTEEINPS